MAACFEIDAHTEHEDRIFTWPPPGARIFLTKAPRDIAVVGPLLRCMRNLHVVYVLRDPRDMSSSQHGSQPGVYWSGLKHWKAYTPHARRLAGHPRFVTVRYEELVRRPDAVQETLALRIPFLEPRAPFSRYHEVARPSPDSLDALRGVRPISAASVGSWRQHLPRVAGQIQQHGSISADLVVHGYEKDRTWESELDGVEPDLRPSHRSEFFSGPARKDLVRGRYRGIPATWLAHRPRALSVLLRLREGYRTLRGGSRAARGD